MKNDQNQGTKKIRGIDDPNDQHHWIPWFEYIFLDIKHEKSEKLSKSGDQKIRGMDGPNDYHHWIS